MFIWRRESCGAGGRFAGDAQTCNSSLIALRSPAAQHRTAQVHCDRAVRRPDTFTLATNVAIYQLLSKFCGSTHAGRSVFSGEESFDRADIAAHWAAPDDDSRFGADRPLAANRTRACMERGGAPAVTGSAYDLEVAGDRRRYRVRHARKPGAIGAGDRHSGRRPAQRAGVRRRNRIGCDARTHPLRSEAREGAALARTGHGRRSVPGHAGSAAHGAGAARIVCRGS